MNNFSEKVSLIWSIADILRGDYKQSEYGRVILPFLVLWRLDQVLAPSRNAVLGADAKFPVDKVPEALRKRMLLKASGKTFYNTSKLDFSAMLDDPTNAAANLFGYVDGFSQNVREIMEGFRFETLVARLNGADLLVLVLRKFVAINADPYRRQPDGSPEIGPDGKPSPNVTDIEMGTIFKELLRKLSEQSNETAGEHLTPRDVIKLMVTLLFAEDDGILQTPGIVRTMYDPACGTGGMLSVAEEHLSKLNPQARLQVYGQELNGESYAICKASMLMRGQDVDNIKFGNSLSDDGLAELKADYLISNPPFCVNWSNAEKVVRTEHEQRGHAGRFGPGLPRKTDGSLLFLLHMMSKMKSVDQGGSRLAIVFNGSPLFSGVAGSGESEIRRWIIENDWLECIVALPEGLFYNTGIAAYICVITNRKSPHRKGKVRLVNGADYYRKRQPSVNGKQIELSADDLEAIVGLLSASDDHPDVVDLRNADFGYKRLRLGREVDSKFSRVVEIALGEDLDSFLAEKIRPEIPDALVSDVKTGYSVKRIAHLGFGLRRELEGLRKEYESCRMIPLEQACLSIKRRKHRKNPRPESVESPLDQVKQLWSASIEADADVLLSDYLAMFLSTDLGQRLLRELTAGDSRGRISLEDLGQLEVPVPTLDEQQALLVTRAKIDELGQLLKRIESELAANPANISKEQGQFLSRASEHVLSTGVREFSW